jgi:hypothetical protein
MLFFGMLFFKKSEFLEAFFQVTKNGLMLGEVRIGLASVFKLLKLTWFEGTTIEQLTDEFYKNRTLFLTT